MVEDLLVTGLADIVRALREARQPFALVGGMAVAVRGEPRFTRDVDLAVAIADDAAMEALVLRLRDRAYSVVALVEHDARRRLATARLAGRSGLVVDLIAASSGIEAEVIEAATAVDVPGVGELPVARAEDLLAMKVLSMTDVRPQDRADALGLLWVNSQMDLGVVRGRLQLITDRGYNREQALAEKLARLVREAEER